MQIGTKKFSVAGFGLALLCFLLPFVTVSCNQQKVASFTGFQLVFGTTVQQPQMFGPPKEQRVDAEPLAAWAFVCCLVALGLAFAKSRKTEIGAAVFAGISLVCLMQLKSKLQDEVLRQSSGFLQVNYESGFWIVVLAILAAGGVTAVAPWRSRGETTATEKHPLSPP
jgi:uncharacterized membrane protein YphA (DoxX/SURF4 family)